MQLWDLTAGKLLNEFKAHTGPITWLEFHPNEFLLATASADRHVTRTTSPILLMVMLSIATSSSPSLPSLSLNTSYFLLLDGQVIFATDGCQVTYLFMNLRRLHVPSHSVRTVKFLDLETFKMVSSSSADTGRVR